MKHVIIIVHIISFLLGFSCILGSMLIYLKNKRIEVRTYTYFLLAFTLILMEQAITSYLEINEVYVMYKRILLNVVSALGCGMLIVFIPQFIHHFFRDEMKKQTKRFFIALAYIPAIVVVLNNIFKLSFVATALSNVAIMISILYSLFKALKLSSNIKQQRIKVVKCFSILTLLMIPYIILDTWIEKLPVIGSYFPYGIISLPIFYGIWNFMTLYFGVKEFKELFISPKQEKAELPTNITLDSFCNYYGITLREKEVIGLIIKGYSYNRISEELVISLSTTKSHVYSVYQKTNVKSKVQLINVINDYLNGITLKA